MVAGSAHLDVLGYARNRDDVVDRVGDVFIEIGGTACNIALNLAHAGVQVRFLSAMNDSPFSEVITKYLLKHGVEPHIEHYENLPTGGFLGLIDTKGELDGAVSSMPVEQVVFDPEHILAAMEGTKAVVMDCNLSAKAMSRLVTFANDRNIPVYIAAVSEEKCVRIGRVAGRIKGIFLNMKEFRFFTRSVLGGVLEPAKAALALQSFMMVMEGAAGATMALPDGTARHIPPPEIGDDGTRLGMGDAMAAGVVMMHEIHGLPIVEAAHKALKMVSWVGSSRHCHPGVSGALETAIDQIQHHAGHDAMTGILNRHNTELKLTKSLARRRQGDANVLSVVMLDIDHFKSINDTYGHPAGDEVIKNVVKAAQDCLRDKDYMGRWGGEEFLIVLPDTARVAALAVSDRIRRSVAETVRHPRPVTVSLGCCEAVGVQSSEMV